MINIIFRFFTNDKKENKLFDKHYRNGYNKLWINTLRNYTPR